MAKNNQNKEFLKTENNVISKFEENSNNQNEEI